MTKFKQGWPLNLINVPASNPVLHGNKVYLCPPCLENFETWLDVRTRSKEFLIPFEPAWPSDALSFNFYKRRLNHQNQEVQAKHGAFFFIFDKQNDSLVGGINLNNMILGAAQHASLGYWLGETYQGKGYMTEAIYLIQNYAFNVLYLHRLNAACLSDNHQSIAVLKRCGFTEEGYAPKYLQINGQWQDHRLFGLVNSVR